MSRARTLLLAVLALALTVPAALAAAPRFSMDEIEQEVMCPICGTRLDLSHSDAANQIRVYITERRARGETKQQVERELVDQFGPAILAETPHSGAGLVAWLVPGLVAIGGFALAAIAVIGWRRRTAAAPLTVEAVLDADAERRVDDALTRYGEES